MDNDVPSPNDLIQSIIVDQIVNLLDIDPEPTNLYLNHERLIPISSDQGGSPGQQEFTSRHLIFMQLTTPFQDRT